MWRTTGGDWKYIDRAHKDIICNLEICGTSAMKLMDISLTYLSNISPHLNGQSRDCKVRVSDLNLRLLMSYIYMYIYIYIYMEHLFLMFLDHTQRRSTFGRTPLD